MKKHLAITSIFSLLTFFVGAQDAWLEPVTYRSADVSPSKEKRNTTGDSATIIYLENIIQVNERPFIDDFSSNRIKQYDRSASDPDLIQILDVLFRVDAAALETFEASLKPTYFIEKNSTGPPDSTEKDPVLVVFYTDADDLDLPTDTDTVWQSFHTRITQTGSTNEFIDPDTIYVNDIDTICLVPDNDRSLWVVQDNRASIGSGVFINNTWGIAPPSTGMATFDGWNEEGAPYDFSSDKTFGLADRLTSKPIYLEKNPQTNIPYEEVFLSFYYQSEGLGDLPEDEDSLVLEFYVPAPEDQWVRVWGVGGEPGLSDFTKVFIQIEERFLTEEFRFRFSNRASLFGTWDHWHIDYIELGPDRVDGELEPDVAYRNGTPNFLGRYTSIPWRHYLESTNPDPLFKSDVEVFFNNLGPEAGVNTTRFTVYDEANAATYTSQSITNSAVQPQEPFNATIPFASSDISLMFPDNGKERATFTIEQELSFSNDITRRYNDTVTYEQYFGTYYSYDDGTIERGMAISGAESKLAVEFETQMFDSLRAVQFYFPQHFEDFIGRTFFLTVWSSLQPEEVLYRSTLLNPRYSAMNEFVRYELPEPVGVNGVFYIGLELLNDPQIFIGFDVNTNNRDRTFLDTGIGWEEGLFDGSLMMRADFGDEEPLFPEGINEDLASNAFDLTVYPNPASDQVRVQWDSDRPMNVVVFDFSGRQILSKQLNSDQALDVSGLANGMYLLKAISQDGEASKTAKLVLHH